MRDIDQINIKDARYIFKWKVAKTHAEDCYLDSEVLKSVRLYLRKNKQTPLEVIVAIDRENSSMPKRIW